MANILLQNVIHSNQANMTGFIVTCEERSVINDTSTCDLTMDFEVSEFEWPESASELQAKLFELSQIVLYLFVILFCLFLLLSDFETMMLPSLLTFPPMFEFQQGSTG